MNLRKSRSVLPLMVSPLMVPATGTANGQFISYFIGTVIALFLLGYLLFSLLKPDKF